MHKSAFEMVDVKRTAHAPRLPPGTEHEMLHEQLAAALEEIGQRPRAVPILTDVVFLDANPGQFVVPLGSQDGKGSRDLAKLRSQWPANDGGRRKIARPEMARQ
jgi:hypothetical protein